MNPTLLRSALLLSLLALIGCGVQTPEDEVIDDEGELGSELSCGSLAPGATLKDGDVLASCGGRLRFVMQGDGNLVLYLARSGTALWASSTFGGAGSRAVMQGDGNLVVYDRAGKARWDSQTHGHPGARLAVQDDGNAVVYARGGKALWASHSEIALARCGLDPDERMKVGQTVLACNEKFGLVVQNDGDLVVYSSAGQAVWRTRTYATGASFAHMQLDGNFVLRDSAGKALWSTGTAGHPFSALWVEDDGTLSIHSRDHHELWTSGGNAPAPTPPGSVPASLVSLLSPRPYVEQSCSAASYPGWPHEAKRCSYSSGGLSASVIVANPSAERAGAWIVDAANLIPALARLRTTSRGHYEEGLKAIGLAMLYQSSRIYPLSGGIIENMGSGYVTYAFEKGVTRTCSSGCYCRINSLHRTEWCAYQAGTGRQGYDACLNQVGRSGLTAGWGAECLENHKRAWTSTVNEHFRAKAFIANRAVSARCPGTSCSPSQVVAAVRSAYGL